MHIHDSSYKKLLSQPTILRQLIQTCVEEEWVQELDFERVERIDKSFISKKYRRTEADLIFKVPFKTGDQAFYFYILLEAQSTVQRFMAVRVAHYTGSFYMDFVHSHPKATLLPPLFPIVLYNGDERWNAPTSLAELIEPYPDLGNYRLSLEYFKIAENEYDREWLLRQSNIATTLFLAEAHYDIHLLYERLVKLFAEEKDRQAVQVFLNWFEQLAVHGYRPTADYERIEREFNTIEEVKSMLMTAIERDREALLEQGIEIGEARGEAKGEARGEAKRARIVARNMTERGFPLATIALVLALTEDEVQALLTEDSAE